MCLPIFKKNKKSLLRLWKQEFKKGKKIAIFPKGFVLGFGKKPEISPCFYFSQNYRPEKCDWRYYRKEKTFFRVWKQEVKKVKKKNCDFFQGGLVHRFGKRFEIFPCFHFSVFTLWKQEVKKVKKKNAIFSKGVSPSVWCKNLKFFPVFVLFKIGQKNVFKHILERKKHF